MPGKSRTYPHSVIADECYKKYKNPWDVLECVINSLELYYNKVTEEELKRRGEKYVVVPPLKFF